MKNDMNDSINLLAEEKQAVESSAALNKILAELLCDCKRREARLMCVIAALILIIAGMIVAFFVRESQFDYIPPEAATESTITCETDGENAYIIYGEQYNDSSTHNEGVAARG